MTYMFILKCALKLVLKKNILYYDARSEKHQKIGNVRTNEVMTSLKFTVVLHPPYSPDLAPSEFWLFPKLKEMLKCQYFSSDAEVETAMRKWISSQPETFFMDGMKKWIERLKK